MWNLKKIKKQGHRKRWDKVVAKVGSQETPGVTGKFDLGTQNEAGKG